MKTAITLVLVTGGRDYMDHATVRHCIQELNKQFDRMVIIHGDAKGADTLANSACVSLGIEQVKIPAAWNKHARAAGPIRNQLMLDLFSKIDLVLAFPGGTGTADMKAKATRAGIPVIEHSSLTEAHE
jgi:aspartate-semialdehyde dehydrogenase